MADPSNIYAIDDIKFITNLQIEVVVASEQAIAEAIEKYYTSEVSFDEVMMDFDVEDEDFEFWQFGKYFVGNSVGDLEIHRR